MSKHAGGAVTAPLCSSAARFPPLPFGSRCALLPAFAADAWSQRACLRVTSPQVVKPAFSPNIGTFREPQRPGPSNEPSGNPTLVEPPGTAGLLRNALAER